MNEQLKALYDLEIEQARLDFDRNPDYQNCLAQVQDLWEGEDMPPSLFQLLEVSNFLSFAHAFRLGLRMGREAAAY